MNYYVYLWKITSTLKNAVSAANETNAWNTPTPNQKAIQLLSTPKNRKNASKNVEQKSSKKNTENDPSRSEQIQY